MNLRKTKTTVRQYFVFYFIGALFIAGMKYYCSKASCDGLLWILTPTARLVTAFCGIPFTYESNVGYVNHELRFIIAASCSGSRFLMITAAALIFSFVHRMGMTPENIPPKTRGWFRRSLFWTIAGIFASYLLTVFVNSLRIVLSVYLPIYFQNNALYQGFLTPERLHTMIGTAVYFISLLTICYLADDISMKISCRSTTETTDTNCPSRFGNRPVLQVIRRCLPPVFWYFLIVLGLPFFNGAYRKNNENFGEFALLISFLCAAVLILFCTGMLLWKKSFLRKRKA